MSVKHIVWSTGAAFCLLLVHSGSAQTVNAQDRKFVMEAAKGGMMEVHLGRMGLERATNRAVRRFAQRMADDHSKGNAELSALAKQKGIALPPDNPSDIPRALSSKTGADWDKQYAKMMIEDHEKDIAEFEKEVRMGTDPNIKKWASDTLPTL